MNYPFILKFSSIQNLSDARYAAGMWADFIGFNFDPGTESYLDPNKAKEIIGWVSGPVFVGEFGQQPPEWIEDFVASFQLKTIQIPSNYNYDLPKKEGVKWIVSSNGEEKTELMQEADLILTYSLNDYERLKMHYNVPVILQTEDWSTDASNLDGLALEGKKEDKPGTSNQADWTDFLEPYQGD
ncbi:MAG TPA: hypothetical protein VGF79_12630 [Bacteroidia bacterium]